MLTNKQVCDQLSSLYPDFGFCGQDLKVKWDNQNRAWVVDFVHDGRNRRHYLENEDAAACIDQKQCVGMGIEFGQLI